MVLILHRDSGGGLVRAQGRRTERTARARMALLYGTALVSAGLCVAVVATSVAPTPALADGGQGATSASGSTGGAGGPGFTGNQGINGTSNGNDGGGGGGGGAGGGVGGTGGGDLCGAGGSGGSAGGSGVPGSSCGGGGGGGGGSNGNGAGAPTINNSNFFLTGGKGGSGGGGGPGFGNAAGGGGGGGAGGYGVIVTGSGASSNTGSISGGDGGTGGDGGLSGDGISSGNGGNGGDGGVAVQFTASGATFTNTGSIFGGIGGVGGSSGRFNGGFGVGGAGIVGSGLTIINSGDIHAGFSQDQVGANAITFTGGTNVLELRAGSSIEGNVLAFSAADTLRLGGTTNSSFDVSQIGANAQYRGFGIFQKTGTSTWTLTGTNTAALPWAIDAGTLVVNGTMINSTMTVESGGTLAGTGTVKDITINGSGTFAPGSGAPGTSMTISGNLAFQSGAIYLVQLNSTAASSVNVNGTASLGGIVQAVFAPGMGNPAKSYDILHANGLGGTFATLQTTNLPKGFTASLSYTPTDVLLKVTAALGGPQQATGLSQNHLSVAGAINNFFNDPPLPLAFLPLFSLTDANLTNALALLSGEAATGAQQVAFQLTNQFLNIMLDPFVDGRSNPVGGGAIGFAPERGELSDDIALAYAKILKAPPKPQTFDQGWSVWGAGYGGTNRTSGDEAVGGSHDLSASAAGGAAGLDYRLAPGTMVGFALAGGGTNWSLAQRLGGGKSDAFQAGVYGTTRSGPAYLAAALAFTNHWMSTDRFAFAGDHLTASINAQSFGGRVESGYRFATIYGGLTPYAAIQSQTFHTPSYSEADLNAGGFALAYNSRSATDTRSELGGRFDRLLLLNPEAALTLRTRIAWAHDWISDPTLAAVFQALPGASFIVNGATPAKNSALTSAGAELRLANGVTLLAKFDGEFASHSQTYGGTGTVRYTW